MNFQYLQTVKIRLSRWLSLNVQISESILYPLGLGFIGVSLAFGLTDLTMAYAIGHISGCHLNPAVSFGLWACKRFPSSELLPYIAAQVIGATVGFELVKGATCDRILHLVKH